MPPKKARTKKTAASAAASAVRQESEKEIQIEEDNQGEEPQSQQAGVDCPSDESLSPSKQERIVPLMSPLVPASRRGLSL
jgi:hypothetical protein